MQIMVSKAHDGKRTVTILPGRREGGRPVTLEGLAKGDVRRAIREAVGEGQVVHAAGAHPNSLTAG